MIFIDAREGLSGDMLLAAMIGLLDDQERKDVTEKMSRAALVGDLDFTLTQVVEADVIGWGVSSSGRAPSEETRTRDEAVSLLRRMVRASGSEEGSVIATKILDELVRAEAAVHERPAEEVHLHEVGRAGAILNMLGIGLVRSVLAKEGEDEFVCSTIVTGKGTVVIAHGAIRVPAPVCKKLLEGFRHETGPHPGERATPTGLAAVRVLASSQSDEVPSRYSKKSVGFGTRRFGGRLGRVTLISR